MKDRLKVGVIGLGAVATVHLEAYKTVPEIDVVAGTDLSPARLAAVRSQYGLRPYQNAADMLASEELDVACILTPPATHEQLTIKCAEFGVHVLCEKPLSLSTASCKRMIEACRSAEVLLCYGASYRYLPALIKARELIQDGELGDILILRESVIGGSGIEHRQTLASHHYPMGGMGGSGMGLVDHGVHLMDTFSWLIGSKIIRALGRGNITGEIQRPEYAHLEFQNGALGQLLYEDGTYSTDLPAEGIFSGGASWGVSGLTASGEWQGHPGCIHVHGTKGAMRIFHYANALYLTNAVGTREIELSGSPMPGNFALQMQAFACAITHRQPPPVSGDVGLEMCRILEGIYASALQVSDAEQRSSL